MNDLEHFFSFWPLLLPLLALEKSQSPVTENAVNSATTNMHVGTGINFAGILAAAGPPPSTR